VAVDAFLKVEPLFFEGYGEGRRRVE